MGRGPDIIIPDGDHEVEIVQVLTSYHHVLKPVEKEIMIEDLILTSAILIFNNPI